MKRIVFFVLICFAVLPAFSQTEFVDSNYVKTRYPQNIADYNKTHVSIEAGGCFMTTGDYGSYSGLFLKPALNYKISDKWNVRAGMLLFNNDIGVTNNEKQSMHNSLYSNAFLFMGADYFVNQKLTLHSSVYKQTNSISRYSFSGYSFGADYKISEKSSIGIEFQFNKGNNPFMYRNPLNPYNNYTNSIFY